MALQVPLDSRDFLVSLEPQASLDQKDELAVRDSPASEEILDLVEQLEQLEILVCTS